MKAQSYGLILMKTIVYSMVTLRAPSVIQMKLEQQLVLTTVFILAMISDTILTETVIVINVMILVDTVNHLQAREIAISAMKLPIS